VSKRDNIFLVGPMGAGKTTVGRRLADLCGLRFVDSDHEIEARCGVEIGYIFEREGEAGFRRREAQAIDALSAERGLVLATGGGAVLEAENRRHLAARGFVVYLQASVEQQLQRTERNDNRPLLRGVDRRATLENLLQIRDPLYREIADLIVTTDGRNARTLAREIQGHFSRASSAA
jgi:shikimate kinase